MNHLRLSTLRDNFTPPVPGIDHLTLAVFPIAVHGLFCRNLATPVQASSRFQLFSRDCAHARAGTVGRRQASLRRWLGRSRFCLPEGSRAGSSVPSRRLSRSALCDHRRDQGDGMVGRFPPGGHPAQTLAETQGPHRPARTRQLCQTPAACTGAEDRPEPSVFLRQRQEIQEVLRQDLRSREWA
jgi:hypothetical protein